MALILLEGLDRAGKSSLAQKFEDDGYEVIHLSAPGKHYLEPGYTGPSYMDDMIELIQKAAHQDIVLDRTHYGELIWPTVYGRKPMLTDEDIEVIREIEESVGVRRILMYDPDVEAHWNRCVANNEPLTRPQFLRARTMYERMANKYGFEKLTLQEVLPDAVEPVESVQRPQHASKQATQLGNAVDNSAAASSRTSNTKKTKEQLRLEKANAINEVLSKRIVKGKGPLYDEIENDVRSFLNKKLGTILGSDDKDSLTAEEIFVVRQLVKRLKEKEAN